NVTKSKVTFSKHRSTLIRKADELSIFCDFDVALVTFSPTGCVVTKNFTRKRHVRCLELKKMKQLDYISGDEKKKLFHLDNQSNLELQLKKTTVELEILHTNLKEHEVEDEKKASLSQIKWCETNLQNTLQEIKDMKAKLLNDSNTSIRKARAQRSVGRQTPLAYNGTTGNRVLNRGSQNLNSSRLMQQHDLRTCPFRLIQYQFIGIDFIIESHHINICSSMAHTVLLDHLYQSRGVSAGYRGASSSSGFNPLAAGAGLTQHAATPPAYPQIQ
ncbi:hypothetical protein E1A91_A02G150300v1, partial [Gossypium mustelinum]